MKTIIEISVGMDEWDEEWDEESVVNRLARTLRDAGIHVRGIKARIDRTCGECGHEHDEEDEDQTEHEFPEEENESPFAAFIRELEELADKEEVTKHALNARKAYEIAAEQEKIARKDRDEAWGTYGSSSDVSNRAEREHHIAMNDYFRKKDVWERFCDE